MNRVAFFTFFLIVWVLASLHFYLRYPLYITDPNFYAEDGGIFYQSLVNRGLIRSIATTFNGYCVSGLYLLAYLGILVNKLIYSGYLVHASKAFAIVSYAFFGLCCTLPFLLVPKLLTLRHAALTAVLLALLPMTSYEYAIIGIIGNLKNVFPYLALIFQLYRSTLNSNDRRVWLCDLCWMLCLFTNPTTLFSAPLYLFDLQSGVLCWPKLRQLRAVNRKLIGLYALSASGIAFIAVTAANAVPPIRGYLDEPCLKSDLVSTMVGRGLLWPLLYNVYDQLNDPLTLSILALLLIFFWLRADTNLKPIFAVGLLSLGAGAAALVTSRSGLCNLASNYSRMPPDQFFLGLNMISVLLFGLACSSKKGGYLVKISADVILCALLVVRLFGLPPWSNFGEHRYMQKAVVSLPGQARRLCITHKSSPEPVTLVLYPAKEIQMQVKKNDLCAHLVDAKN